MFSFPSRRTMAPGTNTKAGGAVVAVGALVLFPLEDAVLAMNCFWFGAAVRFFLLRPGWAMDRMTAPSEHRLYSTLVATLRGLGAMNSAPLLLSALALLGRRDGLFAGAAETRAIFAVLGVAHLGQVVVNVPGFALRYAGARRALRDALRLRPGLLPPHVARFAETPPWPTPDDEMLTVFCVDGALAALNFACIVDVDG